MDRPTIIRPLKQRFTIVELVVVIANISILTALMLPALGKSKTAARDEICINNLHQISMASIAYTDDFDGEFWDHHPQNLHPHDVIVKTIMVHSTYMDVPQLSDSNIPLSSIPSAFFCETSRGDLQIDVVEPNWGLQTGYGFFANLKNGLRPTRIASKSNTEPGEAVIWAEPVVTINQFVKNAPWWYYSHPGVDSDYIDGFWRKKSATQISEIRVQHLSHVDGAVEIRKGISEIFGGDDPLSNGWTKHSAQEGNWYFWWF